MYCNLMQQCQDRQLEKSEKLLDYKSVVSINEYK